MYLKPPCLLSNTETGAFITCTKLDKIRYLLFLREDCFSVRKAIFDDSGNIFHDHVRNDSFMLDY